MKVDDPLTTAATGQTPDSGAFAVGSSQPSSLIPQLPPPVPDHELLRRIGQGSYGDVWLARNKLGTLRAVKVVYRHRFEDARPFEREFKGIQKFEPISRSHEGLVDILQVGGTEDCFYYVMELADPAELSDQKPEVRDNAVTCVPLPTSDLQPPTSGYTPHTLRSDIKQYNRLPVRSAVEIGLALSSALAHLHASGLVHRDVKPSNIIFVGGVAKLADIGLVAETGDARSFVGTEGFIPPEGPGTPQADVYSLGKVLYETSTGKDRHDFPEMPENLLDLADREALIELNAVLVKACANEPRQRYQSAEELEVDLAVLQRGQSVRNRRESQRRWDLARRVSIAAAALILAAAGVLAAKSLLSAARKGAASESMAVHTSSPGTTNLEAQNAYQLGRFFFNRLTREGAEIAKTHFNEAIRLDTNFAAAYAGLADCYIWGEWGHREAMPKLRSLAERLLDLDPRRPEGYAVRAIHAWWAELKPVERGARPASRD